MHVFVLVVSLLFIGLLDEDDSGVEGGDPNSKVLCCISCVLCLMWMF